MSSFAALLKRFGHDERGIFAVLFGIMLVVLVATGGAVVDYVTVEQARNRAQIALDAAALALQPNIYTDSTTVLKDKAQALLIERLNDPNLDAEVEAAQINTTDGTLYLRARLDVPLNFVSLIGIQEMTARVVSQATRKKLNLEVAFVLDNSNSMSDSARMTNLIAATRCAANILLNGDCNSTATTTSVENTYLAIVPFTMLVNVGTGNANASWMDRTGNGATNITNDNFDNDDRDTTAFNGPVDRIALFSQMRNISWGGCVEARVTPYDTNDAAPVSGTGTMFTPLFAPDEPDSGFSNNYLPDRPNACSTSRDLATWTETSTKTSCSATWGGTTDASRLTTFNGCGSSATTNRTQANSNGGTVSPASTTMPVNGTTNNYNDPACTYTWTSTRTSTSPNRYTLGYTLSCTYLFSSRELQERLCKYTGATPTGVSRTGAIGPNSDCPANAIMPLTATKATVTASINQLASQGGTNIHAGTEWGLRVLSPTEPFTQGLPYDQATSKVLIIMTDGDNTAYQTSNMNNSSYYSHYGFPWNGRMGTAASTDAQLETEMNTRTVATCATAKSLGMTVYTIGLSSTNAASIQMLKDCSSGDGHWFFPTQASQLTTVFATIANQLSALRIAQ